MLWFIAGRRCVRSSVWRSVSTLFPFVFWRIYWRTFFNFGMCNGLGHVLHGITHGSHACIHYIYTRIILNSWEISVFLRNLVFLRLFRSIPQNTNHPCELVFCGTERNDPPPPTHTLVCNFMFSRWPSVYPSVRLTNGEHFVPFNYNLIIFIFRLMFFKVHICNDLQHILLRLLMGRRHTYTIFVYE